MTKFLKKDQLSSSWYEIDAKNAVIGRLATVISKIIRGKNKTTFTPHMDDGDFVVVKNIELAKFTKKDQLNSSWYEIDAKNAVVGRLATVVSNIIRGKNKTTYTPHMDDGDFVVVKNIEQAKFTGKKFQDKKYYRHTGHPGGIKVTTPEKLHEKKPGETLKMAVKRMLPGGVLGRKQLTKLKIYAGNDHPHAAQNPTVIELDKLNSKNIARN